MAHNLARLLRTLSPQRNPGVYVYALAAPGIDLVTLQPIATVREREGLTVIAEESRAVAAGLGVRYRSAWITLSVMSELEDVGLTAAVAQALAAANIPCNVVAAVHHDHLFVPIESADEALAVLQALQASAA
jgi:uncharacterized protein